MRSHIKINPFLFIYIFLGESITEIQIRLRSNETSQIRCVLRIAYNAAWKICELHTM